MTDKPKVGSISIPFQSRDGQQLYLERPAPWDQSWLDDLGRHPDVQAFLGGLAQVQELSQAWDTKGYGLFVVRPSPGSQGAMGICGLVEATWKGTDDKELVCVVAPDHRDKRIATEGCKAVLGWCEESGLRPIFGRVAETNGKSVGLMEKLPMRRVGTREDLFDGTQIVYEWP